MKHWITAAALAVGLLACGDGGSGGGGRADAGPGQGQQATGLFGQIVGPDGQAVADATVRAGGATATTGADGGFELAVGAGPVTVRVEADGHLPLIRNTTVRAQAANRFEGQLIAEAPAVALDADAGGQVDGERGARVVVPAGALVGPNGMPAGGMVDVHLTPIDPSVPAQLAGAPGALSARNMAGEPTKLESFGMLDVTMRQGDAELQVAPGQTLQIQIPAPMGQAGEPPAEMPLWSFDDDAGLWVQEGTLTYDAASGTYTGEIQHMSFWNADRELETTCIKGLVTDADGEPIAGAQITSRGVEYNGMDTAASQADGRFAVLARVNSRVNVLASHGGGLEREVMSGADVARQPADPDDPACVDGGTWVTERGVVQFASGERVECDPAALQSFSSCIPLLVDIATCHNPQGACEYTGGGLAGTDYRFENGARVESDVDLETFVVTTTYYGPGDVECGRQIIDTMDVAAGNVIAVELPDGRSAQYGVDFDVDSGAITYTCGDGSTRTLTEEDLLALSACTGGDGAQECAGEPGGGGGGGGCDVDAECGDTEVCCVGVCTAEDLCAFGGRMCEADAECTGDDQVCCPVNGRCLDRQRCVESGWCQGDGDCPNGICCDQLCVNDGRATCAGACEADADCGEDPERPFCCQSDLRDETWCARDEFECYEFMTCGADADCAASGLTCCEGECRSFEDCFSGEACGAAADCGGEGNGLLCCDSDVQGNSGQCSTPTGCYEGTPCNVADGCPADLFCCPRFQVMEGFEGACLVNEGTCNFQLPCASQAECGEGAVCCAEEFLPEPQCFPVDAGCVNTLP